MMWLLFQVLPHFIFVSKREIFLRDFSATKITFIFHDFNLNLSRPAPKIFFARCLRNFMDLENLGGCFMLFFI